MLERVKHIGQAVVNAAVGEGSEHLAAGRRKCGTTVRSRSAAKLTSETLSTG